MRSLIVPLADMIPVAFSLLFAALALSYHLLFGTAGLLSFGHALYFAAGAYGLGILLKNTELGLVYVEFDVPQGTGVLITTASMEPASMGNASQFRRRNSFRP